MSTFDGLIKTPDEEIRDRVQVWMCKLDRIKRNTEESEELLERLFTKLGVFKK